MLAESGRKWMTLVACTWIQAFTGTNFDFSSYSSGLKSALGISQLRLNYLSVASDMGKAFGWCSGVCLMRYPCWIVMFVAAFMGLFGYGIQWLVIHRFISLPYFLVAILCLLAGCSICWFNTVCFVSCIKDFPTNRPLALSLSISYNGICAALYNLIAKTFNSDDDTIYLLLNATMPFIVSIAAFLPILKQSLHTKSSSADATFHDSIIFLFLNMVAIFTGLYLLLLDSVSSDVKTARGLLVGALCLLALPLVTPGIIYAREWVCENVFSRLEPRGSSFSLVNFDDLDLHKGLIKSTTNSNTDTAYYDDDFQTSKEKRWYCESFLLKGPLLVLGEEHTAKMLVCRLDFWLYYITYFCGGTIGIAYSNNLGQISESLGYSSHTPAFVTVYAACSFFGRLLAAAPDFLRNKVYFPRTGWLTLALVPMPVAFALLMLSGSMVALSAATGLIGLSSGFVVSAAVSITSELFGPNSASVNHNILITNIPVGSLLYGLLAALVYDANIDSSSQKGFVEESMVCMGRNCYLVTFVIWGCICLLGLGCSAFLFLRTWAAYDRLEWTRTRTYEFS